MSGLLTLRRAPCFPLSLAGMCGSRPATAGSSGREATTTTTAMMTQSRRRRRCHICDSVVLASASLSGDATSTSVRSSSSCSVTSSLSEEEFERMRAYNLEMEE